MNRTSLFFLHEEETEVPQAELDRMCQIADIEEVSVECCGRFYYLDLDWTETGREYTPEEWEEEEERAVLLCRELNRVFPSYIFKVDDGSQFGTYYAP